MSNGFVCFFFPQMCCLFRLPSLPCVFCHRYPHPAFLSVSTSKAFIIISPHRKESKTAVDSGFRTAWIPDSWHWNLELGFRIPINGGIADSLICIPDSKAQDSTSKFSQILDYTSKNFLDSGIRIPLHKANWGEWVSNCCEQFLKTLSFRLKAGKIQIHQKSEISFGKSLEINST